MKYPISIVALSILSFTTSFGGNFPEEAWGAGYLRDVPRAIDYVDSQTPGLVLEPPPEDDSETTASEIERLKRLSKTRHSKDIILIHKESLDPLKRFFEVLGVSREEVPNLDFLIRHIAEESYLPILYFKHKFSRIRPYHLDTNLITVIDGPPHPSYPSGHATQGFLVASLLADLLPDCDPRNERVLELGKEIGIRREIAGVHYPSDTAAGIALAKQLKPLLLEKPAFQKAFKAAKSELSSIQLSH
ncbi:MAG: phosphatase PAP2 family protein [Verrucomicrobiae bacterium]|nr:phosphatase PAP2 family protein [Verrucomicrobiae bacterium]